MRYRISAGISVGMILGAGIGGFVASNTMNRELGNVRQQTHYEENVGSLRGYLSADKFDSLTTAINTESSDVMRAFKTDDAAKALVGLPKDSLNVVFNRTIAALTKVAK